MGYGEISRLINAKLVDGRQNLPTIFQQSHIIIRAMIRHSMSLSSFKRIISLCLFSLLAVGLLLTPGAASAQAAHEPGLKILSAKEDLHVLIFAHDFPPFLELQVSMRSPGAPDEEAVEITTINAEESGIFFKVLHIPPPLVGEEQIEIKLAGIKSAFMAENTFRNESFEDDQVANLAREILRRAEEELVESQIADEVVVEETSPQEEPIKLVPNSLPVPTTEAAASSWLQSGGEEGEWEDPLPFVWPAEKRWLSGFNFTASHPGIDIAASADDLIFAAASGKVVEVNYSNRGYGNMVLIEHLNGYQTLYAHLNTLLVEAGSFVIQGQPIGLAGSTGNSTGPHLHFEIRYQGEFINPWLFFDR